jgi:hypothetical protein
VSAFVARRRALGALAAGMVTLAMAGCGSRPALEKEGLAGGYKFPGARPSDSGYISDEERAKLQEQFQDAEVKTPPPG